MKMHTIAAMIDFANAEGPYTSLGDWDEHKEEYRDQGREMYINATSIAAIVDKPRTLGGGHRSFVHLTGGLFYEVDGKAADLISGYMTRNDVEPPTWQTMEVCDANAMWCGDEYSYVHSGA